MSRPSTGSLAGLAFALVLPLLPAVAPATTLDEQFDETHPFTAGEALVLSNVNGSIVVDVWERDELRIQAQKKVRAGGEEAAREAMDALRIEVSQSAGELRVETEYPRHGDGVFGWLTGNNVSASVSYHVTLPRRADLELTTVNGKIEIGGVHGDLRLRSTNGGITVDDAGGRVSAHTTNGGISAELREVEMGDGFSLGTTNGGITLSLPRDVRASLSMRTTNGSIDTDFPVAVSGRLSHRHLDGDLNGGGPTIELRTTNGSIRLRES